MEDKEMALEVEELLFKTAKGLVLTAVYTVEEVNVLDAFGWEGDETEIFISDGEIWVFRGAEE